MAKPKETRGRKARAGAAATPMAIRLTASERAAYRAAAKIAGLSVGDWIRAACASFLKRIKS